MLYDYQREELRVQAKRAEHNLKGNCPLIEDEVALAVWNHIQELESDRRRLEWLALNNARVWLQDGWYDIHDNGRYLYCFMVDDWRDAIDKVMQESE